MRLERLVSVATLVVSTTLLSGCNIADVFMLVFAGAVPVRPPSLAQGATPQAAVFSLGAPIPIGVIVTNPGPAVTGDLFGGVVLAPQLAPSVGCLPDSSGFALAIQFVFGETRTRCLSDILARPQDLVPLRNLTVPGALPETTLTSVFTFTPTQPGNYTAFFVFTPPGAFQGGRLNVFYHAAAMTTFQVLP